MAGTHALADERFGTAGVFLVGPQSSVAAQAVRNDRHGSDYTYVGIPNPAPALS